MTSSEAVVIRDYQPGDGPGIVALLNEVFAEDDPDYAPRTEAQWRWIYRENPAGNQIIVATEPDGRIVGHYACIPYQVTIAGTRNTCGQGVDSMVSAPDRCGLKAQGLFLRTAGRYFERYGVPERNAFGYGFPNKKAFRIGVRLLNYLPVQAPVLTLGRNLFDKSADDEVGVGADPAGSIVAIDRCDARVDHLWARMEAEVAMGTVRDARFLNWRYLDCPFAPHHAFGLADSSGELRGLFIARDDWTGPPIQALVEFIVPSSDQAGAIRLLAHAVQRARDVGQQRVELWVPPPHPWFALIQARGFVAEECAFNLCVKIYDPGLDPDWVRAHWYYSIGDTDVF